MKKLLALSALFLTTAATAPALADSHSVSDLGTWDKERFQIRVRAIGVLADGDGTLDGTTTPTDVDDAYTPEIDISYFFTDHIGAELIAATSEHTVSAGGANVGDAWILPPTLTLQYHFQRDQKFSPYVGAGVNYSMFYGDDAAAGFRSMDVDGGFGLALQAGADYWLGDNWGLNLDVKYIDLQVDVDAVTAAGATVQASDVDLDPWIVGAGVSYRF